MWQNCVVTMEELIDLFVIGGGINGTAIAADAAGRGLSVILCEKNDLASGTSSASTKLIHGGLRYLELYDFKLVREALREREILMRKAPNLIKPLQFILPYETHLRPAWLIRLGLFLYDHLSSGNTLPNSSSVFFKNDPRGIALQDKYEKGFSYYDCSTDDARLVVLNAVQAEYDGARIHTQTDFVSATRENSHWKIELKNKITNKTIFCYAKALVNAAGPWINAIQKNILNAQHFKVELVKGSHIVLPKLYEGDFAYILQNSDNRIIFTIPYLKEFTLIGTTDVAISDDLQNISIIDSEIEYLCKNVNRYFKKSISKENIISSYSGVRCLQSADTQNVSKISRDYKLILQSESNIPLLTIIGGKITTHRMLAEKTLTLLKPFFPKMKAAWTAKAALPGCDFGERGFQKFYLAFKKQFSWLDENLAYRYASQYGTRADILLENANSMLDLGEKFSDTLFQKEVEFLIKHEWACTSDDILWRRTKLGMFLSELEKNKLNQFIQQYGKLTPDPAISAG